MKVLSLGAAAILWTACMAGPVDINSATASELSETYWVWVSIAQRIVEFHELQGFFPTPDSIQLVLG